MCSCPGNAIRATPVNSHTLRCGVWFSEHNLSRHIMQSIFSPAARRTILEQNGKFSAATVG